MPSAIRLRPLLIALAACTFALSTTAEAAPTRYTVDWNTVNSPGQTVGGVTVTSTHVGSTYVYGSPYFGLYIGRNSGSDARISFSTPVSEFCWYATGQNVGEVVTMTTSRSTGNTFRVVDTGSVTSTLSGNTVRWNGVVAADADQTLTCIANTAGFDWVYLDHNGVTSSGLVLTRRIWIERGCTAVTWYRDADNDTYGGTTTTSACTAPSGYVARTGDCDDADRFTYPGAGEVVGDEKDQSCDGEELCYADFDDDGYRTSGTVVSTDEDCRDSGEATATEPDGDCNDRDAATYPGAPEVAYDGIDQDCSGADLCDVDGDGFAAGIGSCVGTDCNDGDEAINPAAGELWYDGTDQDCDGWSDFDSDYDGFDSADWDGEDCDDTDEDVNPDADEIWYDDVDQDCDGASDFDADGDGYDSSRFGGEDCDDENADVYPGAPELDDGIDNDCNGRDEAQDSDGDGLTDDEEDALGTDPYHADSDRDGVPDGAEVGLVSDPRDSDDDGTIDALDEDDDGDGIPTRREGDQTVDTDRDGTPDYLDGDSDGDGIDDAIEGTVDSDRDGMADYVDLDSDNDSVLDADEVDADSDGDGLVDRIDPDDDDDRVSTLEEESWDDRDMDGDGIVNYLDPDADGDGRDDVDEGVGDDDCDGLPNVRDVDDFDGPCANPDTTNYRSGACGGASTTGTPAGVALLLIGLLALRRRRR